MNDVLHATRVNFHFNVRQFALFFKFQTVIVTGLSETNFQPSYKGIKRNLKWQFLENVASSFVLGWPTSKIFYGDPGFIRI